MYRIRWNGGRGIQKFDFAQRHHKSPKNPFLGWSGLCHRRRLVVPPIVTRLGTVSITLSSFRNVGRTLYQELRRQSVRKLALRKELKVEERDLMPDHAHAQQICVCALHKPWPRGSRPCP